jgi:hypothetical protein
MLLFDERFCRHAELVSASFKTTLKYVQNRRMCMDLKEMPKQVRHDMQGCCVLHKTVFMQLLMPDFKFLIIRIKDFSSFINHEAPLNVL